MTFDRRSNRLLIAACWTALASTALAQECWDEPVGLFGTVCRSGSSESVEGKRVELRTYVGPLIVQANRLAAFEPAIAERTLDASGKFTFQLPAWSAVLDHPLAVVMPGRRCRGSGELVRPFDRDTHRPVLQVWGNDRPNRIRFVDPAGDPIVRARVAALVPVTWASGLPPRASGGPEFENLVSTFVGDTDEHGWLAIPSDATVALVERGEDAVPVVVWAAPEVVIPSWFEPAAADVRLVEALKDDNRLPPDARAIAAAERRLRAARGVIEGVVLDPAGAPVRGADVSVAAPDAPVDLLASLRAHEVRPRVPFAQTDHDGRFRIAHLRGGRYRLHVAAAHFPPKRSKTITLREGQHLDCGAVSLARGAALVVQGSMGCVVISSGGDERASRCFEGPNGLIDGLAPGKLVISSWNGGCCGGPVREVRVPEAGVVVVDFDD